jgi:hypothetical protein
MTAKENSEAWIMRPLLLLVFGLTVCAGAGETPRAPVPQSPYLGVAYRYADAMLQSGRDTYGPAATGLFLSAFDRTASKPLTYRPPAPAGIREGDRVGLSSQPLVGANPQHDENLLRLLYTLSELSGEPRYREAADAELNWFLRNAASSSTHLLPWGEHMFWNVLADAPQPARPRGVHEFFRPWVLWDRCFELAPEASERFALGLWEHQIADHATGAFNRHAPYWEHGPADGMDFPRHAGFYIRTWAVAYSRTKNPEFLRAIEVVRRRFENKRHPQTGLIEMTSGSPRAHAALTLSLAIDCDGAARCVPEPLASHLKAFADREDEVFCSLPHDLRGRGGFVVALDRTTTQRPDREGGFATAPAKENIEFSPLWDARYGAFTTAQVAMMCVARYDNTGKARYRDLITAAADCYANSLPEESLDAWPMTFGHAISLQLAAWRHTARPAYLERARALADAAIARFWAGGALPSASVRSRHYETITGADTLALALAELHLQILHITAVRCPPNTIDR